MKLHELFESIGSDDIYHYAEQNGYKKQKGSKTVNDEKFPVIVLTKKAVFGDVNLEFKYIINPDTHAWNFEVSQGDEDGVEIAKGEDNHSLVNHLKKKVKLSQSKFETYFLK